MLGFLPTRAYRPGTPGATTFLSPLSGTFNYGWDSFDPAGYGSHINPLANVSTVEAAVSRFSTACNRARKAERFAESGKIPAAFEEWRKIFPHYFPRYG